MPSHYINQWWLENNWATKIRDQWITFEWFPFTNIHLKLSNNSMRLSDAYMRQYILPTLGLKMACRLFGAKPLSEPILPYCQLDHEEHISVKFYLKNQNFSFKEMPLKLSSAKRRPFISTQYDKYRSHYNSGSPVNIQGFPTSSSPCLYRCTMMTSSMETFPHYWPFVRGIHWSPVNSPHKGQWRWVWTDNRDAGDLRRNRAHYDVTVMRGHPGGRPSADAAPT